MIETKKLSIERMQWLAELKKVRNFKPLTTDEYYKAIKRYTKEKEARYWEMSYTERKDYNRLMTPLTAYTRIKNCCPVCANFIRCYTIGKIPSARNRCFGCNYVTSRMAKANITERNLAFVKRIVGIVQTESRKAIKLKQREFLNAKSSS